jgi:hypothetical protein
MKKAPAIDIDKIQTDKVEFNKFLHSRHFNNLRKELKQVSDTRYKRGVRYNFHGVLLLIVCAVFCGAKTYTDIYYWPTKKRAKKFFKFDKVPSIATISRIVASIDLDELNKVIYNWSIKEFGKYKKNEKIDFSNRW